MYRVSLSALAIFSLLFPTAYSHASPPAPRPGIERDAEIVAVRGEGWVKFIQQKEWLAAAASQALTSGDTVKTGDHCRMAILFTDGSQIKVHDRTTIRIRETGRAGRGRGTVLDLDAGEVWSRTNASPDGLRIATPSATAAIRGTDWDLRVDEKGTSYLLVLKGEVAFYNDLGSVSVSTGEQAVAEAGKAPAKTFLVRPKDRVQWIISYPVEIPDIVAFRTYRRPDALKALSEARHRATTADTRLTLAEFLYDAGQRDESMKIVQSVLEADPDNSRALVVIGYLHLARGESDAARRSFTRAMETASPRYRSLSRLGLAGVHLQKNEIEAAGRLLEGLDTEAALPEAGIALARFRAFTGDFTGAIGISARYAQGYPSDERFQVMIADFAITIDDHDRSEGAIREALAANPDSAAAHTIDGRRLYLRGESSKAERSFRKALFIDPSDTLAMSELGKLLMEDGRFEEAREQLSSAIEKAPHVSSFRSRRGMLMNWLEDLPAAGHDLEKAAELNAGDYQTLNGLGVIALKEGRTQEAVQYFLRAGILEPNYAEPHIFLAIAYYQADDIFRALAELKVAKDLDPRDPVPHVITYIIYQDTYRPIEAVSEAGKALELLPNLKSVNPYQDTKRGLSNLGSALLGIGMEEWAGSYAEESFDLFDSASYRFVSNRFADNPVIYLSANMQSFLLNPMSIGFDTRFQDIVLRPQHNFQVRTRLGFEEGHPASMLSLIQEGYFRRPFEINYLLQLDAYKNDGFRDNGYSRGYFLTYALGGRPDYRNGFFIYGGLTADKLGQPGQVNEPDADDSATKRNFQVTGGYNWRLGRNKNILVAFQHSTARNRYKNPSALGAVLTDPFTASFINWFGLEKAGHIYFYEDAPVFDPDDILAGAPFFLAPITAGLPAALDTDIGAQQDVSLQSTSFHLKHIVEINRDHQLSLGIERTRHSLTVSQTDTLREDPSYGILYVDLPSQSISQIPYYDTGRFDWTAVSQAGATTTIYLDDRWKVSDSLLLEAGLFYELYHDDMNGIGNLDPRVGLSWKFLRSHILRVAAQKRLLAVDPTMAPFTTAGVGFTYPRSQAFPGDIVTDYQAGIESRWTDRIFTELRLERRFHRWQRTRFEFPDMTYSDREDVENRADIINLALNVILTDRIGVFARYTNTRNENLSGRSVFMPYGLVIPLKGKEAQFEPHHTVSGGIVWVSPKYMKASITARYVSSQFTDDDNSYRMPGYWSADFGISREFFKKHLRVALDVRNMFDTYHETDEKMPGPGRSVFLACEYRF